LARNAHKRLVLAALAVTVTSQNDVDDGRCDLANCSLREAIVAANATDVADEILFSDDKPITPLTPLPPITETAHIGSFGRCRVDSAPLRLDGAGSDFPGLVYAPGSDGSQICLVNIRGFLSELSRCALVTAGPSPPADDPPDDPPPKPGSSDPPEPVGDGPAPPLGIPVIDVPPRPRCKVPNVVGLTLAKAKRRVALAGCGAGKVTKPKRAAASASGWSSSARAPGRARPARPARRSG
jgi:CSLREA domain-containing protein